MLLVTLSTSLDLLPTQLVRLPTSLVPLHTILVFFSMWLVTLSTPLVLLPTPLIPLPALFASPPFFVWPHTLAAMDVVRALKFAWVSRKPMKICSGQLQLRQVVRHLNAVGGIRFAEQITFILRDQKSECVWSNDCFLFIKKETQSVENRKDWFCGIINAVSFLLLKLTLFAIKLICLDTVIMKCRACTQWIQILYFFQHLSIVYNWVEYFIYGILAVISPYVLNHCNKRPHYSRVALHRQRRHNNPLKTAFWGRDIDGTESLHRKSAEEGFLSWTGNKRCILLGRLRVHWRCSLIDPHYGYMAVPHD